MAGVDCAVVSGYDAIEQCKTVYIRVVPDMQALPDMSKAGNMSQTPFMPLWVADFVGDTLDLDAKEVGAYMLILMTLWGRDGYLPNDEKKLQRVARCGRDWPRIWAAISHYFTVDGDKITQGRLLKEVQKVASKREVNAQSGYLGGKAKSLKSKETALANAIVSPKQPEPEPERRSEIGKPISRGSAENEILSELEKWASKPAAESFIAYRKRMKGKALTVLAAKRIAATLGEIFNARGDPDDALGMAEEKGWMSVQADWYFRAKKGASQNGQQNAAFGATINAIADDLSAGTIRLDNSRSDPFAPR